MRVFVVFVLLVSLRVHAGEWQEVVSTDVDGRPLRVLARERADSDVKEVMGEGSFAAPPWVIKNVIDDVARYQEFMPFTKHSPVVATGDGWVVSYQRLAIPFLADRDYAVKIVDESVEDANGKVTWKNRWSQANHLVPPPAEGVLRVAAVDGWWRLEDLDQGTRTKATYYVYTNPGGALPAALVNLGNARGVPDLFRAVAKAASLDRYRATRPVPRKSLRAPPTAPPTAPTTAPTTPAAARWGEKSP
jgi:hypothetical protein